MLHFKWMYLAGAAAAVCASSTLADALPGHMSSGFGESVARASNTLGVLTAGNSSTLFSRNRGGSVASGQHADDQQGDDQQSEDQQGDNEQGDDDQQGDDRHGKGHGDDRGHGDDQYGKGGHGSGEYGNGEHGKGHSSNGKPSSGKQSNGKPGSVGSTGVPEPGTAALLAASLLGFGMRYLRRRLPRSL